MNPGHGTEKQKSYSNPMTCNLVQNNYNAVQSVSDDKMVISKKKRFELDYKMVLDC